MRFLVFQHIDVEHPGIFRDFMDEDGIGRDTVELDEGEPIPGLDGYDALIVMGGPMDTWEEDAHPWLVPEKKAIGRWVEKIGKPFLGVCLGHQLLADSVGGGVARMAEPEVGICDVALTEEGRADPLFRGLGPILGCLQWHGAEVSPLPAGAVVLASNPACAVQALRVGAAAYGLQFHGEITAETVPDWGKIPAYREALESIMGVSAQERLERDAAARLPEFNSAARVLYENFIAIVRHNAA
ncbi:MAG: type 1 glutamine amidotransferase [Rhodospirillales bacterium]|jgi:GMP synthase-like glutamine amidotransferase|nr:type 1 glutamine amidotransferase [Rhodospirillales bacterium]MDP6772649.1 type 1 glutamine amidotransferase [Rhodospirillales bacterium]